MAALTPPSAKQPTTGTGEHREEELRKWRLMWFALLTFNSGLSIYLSWGDLEYVASVVLTYGGVVLVSGRRFGCWEPRTEQGRRWLDAVMWSLFLLLAMLLVSRLARTATSSASSVLMLVAAAGAAALGVGGGCAYLLHRRSCSKQQRQEVIPLTA